MTIKQQTEFTPTEARAICEMMAALAAENYKIRFSLGIAQLDSGGEGKHYPYQIEVIDPDDKKVSSGRGYFLVDALLEAYRLTPERGKQ